ncbi:MAG: hypothetical protein FJX76_00135 [Armatimonadetes bacterium]|nr:hypothetical protein [Armatimonadota bacterium]
MTDNLTPFDARTALELELGRFVENAELLEWFVYGVPSLSRRVAQILRSVNLDTLIAGLEATLMEKLSVQEAVYERLARMLDGGDAVLARDILARSTSSEAAALLHRRARLA